VRQEDGRCLKKEKKVKAYYFEWLYENLYSTAQFFAFISKIAARKCNKLLF